MPAFDPLTASALLILASAPAQTFCDQPAPAVKISVIPKTKPIKYDYSQSLADIQSSPHEHTHDPYGIHGGSITQGFMDSQMKFEHEIGVTYQTFTPENMSCLWYKAINVTIEIDPKIVIAREVKADRCMFKAVLDHEKMHINIDRRIINQAVVDIDMSIHRQLSKMQSPIGPIPSEKVKAASQKMVALMKNIITKEADRILLERQEKQNAFDSREEYDRIAALCPKFLQNKNHIYERALNAKTQSR